MATAQQVDFSIWSFCFAKGQLPRDFIEGAPVASNQGLIQVPMVYCAPFHHTAGTAAQGLPGRHRLRDRTLDD